MSCWAHLLCTSFLGAFAFLGLSFHMQTLHMQPGAAQHAKDNDQFSLIWVDARLLTMTSTTRQIEVTICLYIPDPANQSGPLFEEDVGAQGSVLW